MLMPGDFGLKLQNSTKLLHTYTLDFILIQMSKFNSEKGYREFNLENKAFFGQKQQTAASPGGLEPPTFRLTAERADRLRHGDLWEINKNSVTDVILTGSILFYLNKKELTGQLKIKNLGEQLEKLTIKFITFEIWRDRHGYYTILPRIRDEARSFGEGFKTNINWELIKNSYVLCTSFFL